MIQENYEQWSPPAARPNPLRRWWKQFWCHHREMVTGPEMKTDANGGWWVEASCACPHCGKRLPLPFYLEMEMNRMFTGELTRRVKEKGW